MPVASRFRFIRRPIAVIAHGLFQQDGHMESTDEYVVYFRLNRRLPRNRDGSPRAGAALGLIGADQPIGPNGLDALGRRNCYFQHLDFVPSDPRPGDVKLLRVRIAGYRRPLKWLVKLQAGGAYTDTSPYAARLGC